MAQQVRRGLPALVLVASLLSPRAGWTFEKLECVTAHEQSQQLWQRDLLVESREQLLICGDPSCPTLVRDDCVGWLSRVDERLQAERPPSRELSDAQRSGRTPDAPARTSAKAVPTAENAVPAARRARREPGRGLDDEEPASGRWQFLRSPAVPAALSVVALATGAYFGLRGLSEAERLRQSCAPRCGPDEVSAVRRQLVIADVSAVVGVGFAALAGWMLWERALPASSTTEHARAGAADGVSAGVSGNSLRLHYSRHF